MMVSEAVNYFGTQAKLATSLGVVRSTVSLWKSRKDGLIPELQARKLAEKYPELKFDASAYQNH